MTLLEGFGNLVRAVAGMFVVLGVWALIQRLVRQRSGCGDPDKDMLEFMLHGCGEGCGGKGECHSRVGPIETPVRRGA